MQDRRSNGEAGGGSSLVSMCGWDVAAWSVALCWRQAECLVDCLVDFGTGNLRNFPRFPQEKVGYEGNGAMGGEMGTIRRSVGRVGGPRRLCDFKVNRTLTRGGVLGRGRTRMILAFCTKRRV